MRGCVVLATIAVHIGAVAQPMSADFRRVNDALIKAMPAATYQSQRGYVWDDREDKAYQAAAQEIAKTDLSKVPDPEAGWWISFLKMAKDWDHVVSFAQIALKQPRQPFGKINTEMSLLDGLVKSGRVEEAIAFFDQIEPDGGTYDRFALSEIYATDIALLIDKKQGQKPAFEFLDHVLKTLPDLDPKKPDRVWVRNYVYHIVARAKAQILEARGDRAAALREFDAVLARKGDSPQTLSETRSIRQQLALKGTTAPRLEPSLFSGSKESLGSLKGRTVILEFAGGATELPTLEMSPVFQAWLKKTSHDRVAYRHALWTQRNMGGWIDLTPREEFEILKGFHREPSWQVGLADVKRFGLNSPGTVVIGPDGRIAAYYTMYSRETLPAFLEQIEKLVR